MLFPRSANDENSANVGIVLSLESE